MDSSFSSLTPPRKTVSVKNKSHSPNTNPNRVLSHNNNKSPIQSNKSIKLSDRFIPLSISNNLKSSFVSKDIKQSPSNISSPNLHTIHQINSAKKSESNYQRALIHELLDVNPQSSNKLRFSHSKDPKNHSLILKPSSVTNFNTTDSRLIINKGLKEESPYQKINYRYPLDNFYYNVLDMYDTSRICIGTQVGVFIYNILDKAKGENAYLHFISTADEIHSVKFIDRNALVFSNENEELFLYDITSNTPNLKYNSLLRRNILSIDLYGFNHSILFFGSNNGFVEYTDIREKTKLNFLYSHKLNDEVCKVKYSNQNSLLFSGGNDNQVIAFDFRMRKVIKSFKHRAAVKGIAINEKESQLVTGGGTYDKTIKLWDIKKMSMISETQTESQVTNLEFINNIVIAGFGYIGNNIILYDLNYHQILLNELSPQRLTNSKHIDEVEEVVDIFKPIGVFEKHFKRILYMAKSFDSNWLSTSSNDGVIKIWKLDKYIHQKTGIQSDMIEIR